MEFVKIMEIKARMCLNKSCSVCPLSSESNGKGKICGDFIMKHPVEAEQILIEWDKAHPVKTFLSDFLEKFPNAPLGGIGLPKDILPCSLGLCKETCWNDKCKTFAPIKCWNRPLEVQK